MSILTLSSLEIYFQMEVDILTLPFPPLHTHTHISHLPDIQAPNVGNPVFTCDKHFSGQAPMLVTNPSESTTDHPGLLTQCVLKHW